MESLQLLNVTAVQPPPDAIAHFATSIYGNRLEFEWHPKKKKVYLIRFDGKLRTGEAIAHEIENHGAAWNAVLLFNRGYKEALDVERSISPRSDEARTAERIVSDRFDRG